MNDINKKIIDSIIKKAELVCPNSLGLIGVYGSISTGDCYQKSDLDLLILILDDDGWKLSTGFILDDVGIGYDIYCTTMDDLKYDAKCEHAHLSKLLDSKIVYVKNQHAYDELMKLRENALQNIQSIERINKSKALLDKAKVGYANSHIHNTLGSIRMDAYDVIYYLLDAVMLFNGKYFKLGVKRTFEEINNLPIDKSFRDNILKIAKSNDLFEIRDLLKDLISYVDSYLIVENIKVDPSKDLAGTYEEMFSNWRNKVEEAYINNDVFSSYINMCSLQYMFNDINNEVNIGKYNVIDEYNPNDLKANISVYDKNLVKYKEVYESVNLKVKHYNSIDEFVSEYLKD